jgi:secondary thiamine-phosphate synthase enzyme
MQQAQRTLEIMTRGRSLTDLTNFAQKFVTASTIRTGLLTLFCRHTSASLLICENADPQVMEDLERFLTRLVPDGDPLFHHRQEGLDDMPAHIRSCLTQSHLSIPVQDGKPVLGIWQGLYLYEHRTQELRREVVLHLIGE